MLFFSIQEKPFLATLVNTLGLPTSSVGVRIVFVVLGAQLEIVIVLGMVLSRWHESLSYQR